MVWWRTPVPDIQDKSRMLTQLSRMLYVDIICLECCGRSMPKYIGGLIEYIIHSSDETRLAPPTLVTRCYVPHFLRYDDISMEILQIKR